MNSLHISDKDAMHPEKQYMDFFTQHEDVLHRYAPAFMNALRTQALADFERTGFPSPLHEDYRYTDVAKAFAPDYGLNLTRLHVPTNPSDVFRCDVPNMSTSLYFVVNDSLYTDTLPKTSLSEEVYAGGMHAFAELHPEIASRYYGKAADTSADAVSALNTMLAQDGFVLYVPRGVHVERPVQLINIFRRPDGEPSRADHYRAACIGQIARL